MNVFFLGEKALENALFTVDVAFLATQGIDKRLQAKATCIKGLYRVLAEPLLLRAISELTLLIVREKGEIVIVL